MASGQQKAQQNVEAFEVWKATQTDGTMGLNKSYSEASLIESKWQRGSAAENLR